MQLKNSNFQSHVRAGVAAGAVILLAAAVGLCGCEKGQHQQAPAAPHQQAPAVSVVTVETQKITLTTELPGRTAPFRIAEIRPQVSGIIEKRLFEEGTDVTAGQLLYQIDPAPFQAALDSAVASLGRAEANLIAVKSRADRYRDLLADKAVSRQDYDDAASAVLQVQAEIKYWEAQVTAARINLDYTRVTAPISGRIGRSNVTDGAMVTAYQPLALAVIQQLDPIYVDAPQSTAELLRLKDNGGSADGDFNKVKLILEDDSPYPLEGTLQFADVTVDPATGSVILRAVFPNPEGVLLPGMFVRAVIAEGADDQAILIPQQGVSRNTKGNPYAMTVDSDGKAQIRPLVLERAIADKWLVEKGLAPGDRVIVEGLLMLRPGTPVNAVPFGSPPAGGPPGVSSPEKSKGGA